MLFAEIREESDDDEDSKDISWRRYDILNAKDSEVFMLREDNKGDMSKEVLK